MSSIPPSLVQARSVGKRYGQGPVILEDVSFDVCAGEFVAILGPSGCGKTTLLRLLAGISPISQGQLLIDQLAPASAAHEVACVFQDATLLPWLTLRRNAELLLRLRGFPPETIEQRVAHTLELLRLTDYRQSYPWQLSGGQRMRASLARALVTSPKLLLLDEPFASLDEITRERLNEELLLIRGQQSWTAFFVTHSVAEAVFLSQRILILSASPARLIADLPISLPYPRTAETRLGDDYLHLVANVSRQLRQLSPANP